MTTSEYLMPVRALLSSLIENDIHGEAALEVVRKAIDELPELQGSCSVCLAEVDHMESGGTYKGTEPIPVVLCANGCRGCEECVKPCADGRCNRQFCQDCLILCEGCGSRFCEDHVKEDPNSTDCWCDQCMPTNVRREIEREAAQIED